METNYDFIRNNARVYWYDPAINDYPQEERESKKRTIYTIFGLEDGEEIDDDTIISISDGTTDAEVYASELRPAYCHLTNEQRKILNEFKMALRKCYDNHIEFVNDVYGGELIAIDNTDVDKVLWADESNDLDESTIDIDTASAQRDYILFDSYLAMNGETRWVKLKSRK